MRMNKKGLAYTLAEIMVVLLVLTIIFAAFAPLITKRKVTTNKSKYNVWSAVNPHNSFDAEYQSENTAHTAQAFFGMTPGGSGEISSVYYPYSKVIIRSGPVTSSSTLQRQIQFRFGRSSFNADEKKYGKFAGTWFMDGSNMLMGGEYAGLDPQADNIEASANTAIGFKSLNNITTGRSNTALGSHALASVTTGKYNTAIGYKAGNMTTGNNNTFIGSGAGEKVTSGNANTAIGYNAGGHDNNSTGSLNTFIGAYAGSKVDGASKNVGIGYNALGSLTTGDNNIAIGYNALGKLVSGSYNTAIGYNACANITNSSNKTCIGANSGPRAGSYEDKYLKATSGADTVERTYIGSPVVNPNPLDKEAKKLPAGDAILEIHNVGGSNSKLQNNPTVRSNTTTVINGNLIVRGRTYLTFGNKLRNFTKMDVGSSGMDEGVGNYHGKTIDEYYTCADNQTKYSLSQHCIPITPKSSDRRLKNITSKNIAGLKELNKLKVYNYTFKNDEQKLPHVGVIAQDLQKVFPNSVFEGKDGYLRIRWDEMFFTSINAIKELDKKIVALVKRTVNIETQIAQLEKENTSLKSQVDKLSARVDKLKNK
ncbi:hypothetical protein HDR58_03400 [bacterium]|nr:hypothetical protein [bacterium]